MDKTIQNQSPKRRANRQEHNVSGSFLTETGYTATTSQRTASETQKTCCSQCSGDVCVRTASRRICEQQKVWENSSQQDVRRMIEVHIDVRNTAAMVKNKVETVKKPCDEQQHHASTAGTDAGSMQLRRIGLARAGKLESSWQHVNLFSLKVSSSASRRYRVEGRVRETTGGAANCISVPNCRRSMR